MIFNQQIHLFSCFAMCGLIWLIQLIHYPAYHYIDAAKFSDYQRFHTVTITFLVGPLMTVELITALLLLADNPKSWGLIINLGSVGAIWLATLLLSVPAHNKLAFGYSYEVVQNLVHTNWIRTLIWSARSAVWIWILTVKGSN